MRLVDLNSFHLSRFESGMNDADGYVHTGTKWNPSTADLLCPLYHPSTFELKSLDPLPIEVTVKCLHQVLLFGPIPLWCQILSSYLHLISSLTVSLSHCYYSSSSILKRSAKLHALIFGLASLINDVPFIADNVLLEDEESGGLQFSD